MTENPSTSSGNDERKTAVVGDVYTFVYPTPNSSCELKVVRVLGAGPEDLVFFHDGTHAKQKHLEKVPRVETAACDRKEALIQALAAHSHQAWSDFVREPSTCVTRHVSHGRCGESAKPDSYEIDPAVWVRFSSYWSRTPYEGLPAEVKLSGLTQAHRIVEVLEAFFGMPLENLLRLVHCVKMAEPKP